MDEQAALNALARRDSHLAEIDQLIAAIASCVDDAAGELAIYDRETERQLLASRHLRLRLGSVDALRSTVVAAVRDAIRAPVELVRVELRAGETLANIAAADRSVVVGALDQYKQRTATSR